MEYRVQMHLQTVCLMCVYVLKDLWECFFSICENNETFDNGHDLKNCLSTHIRTLHTVDGRFPQQK